MAKTIYRFGKKTDGDSAMKNLLGGKGVGLTQMSRLGVPVPPGFIIPTTECINFQKTGVLSAQLKHDIMAAYAELCSNAGERVLVSVRSGARVSMPGMMDTILNVGLTSETIDYWSDKLGERAAYDSYRRLIQMYGSVALGVPDETFAARLSQRKAEYSVTEDKDLPVEGLKSLVSIFKDAVSIHAGCQFPDKIEDQILSAVEAVFKSWDNERAKTYRKINKIPDSWGTAVVIQTMVFGNLNDDSGSGVLFTRNPSTGDKVVFGEFLPNAQGEDVVAGIRTPLPLPKLGEVWPEVLKELSETVLKLERHYKDMQDVEFTIQNKKLYILQTRNGKRSALAAFKIASDMLEEGLINPEDALKRVTGQQFKVAKMPQVDPSFTGKPHVIGIDACPGVASGVAVLTAQRALDSNVPCILVTKETNPDDIAGMAAASGVLTATGGATSHAAVVARSMDKPCVVGCTGLKPTDNGFAVHLDDGSSVDILEGTKLTIDGATGNVWVGVDVPVIDGSSDPHVQKLVDLAVTLDDCRLISRLGGDRNMVFLADIPVGAEAAMMSSLTKETVLDVTNINKFTDDADLQLWCLFGVGEHQRYASLLASVVEALLSRQDLKGMMITGLDYPADTKRLREAGYRVFGAATTVGDLLNSTEGVLVTDDFVNTVLGGKEAYAKLLEIFDKAGVVSPVAKAPKGKFAHTVAFEKFGT